jgi:hypothetical protein
MDQASDPLSPRPAMTQNKLRQHFFVNAERYDRREDAHACALRMARMLDELETGHPALARWYRLYEVGATTVPRGTTAVT